MYNRAEAAQTRQAFWTVFGQYMAPQLSAAGERINWINYKTGEKNIRFLMEADTRAATIFIELSHADAGLQQLYFEQFQQYKKLLDANTGEPWTWRLHHATETARLISTIGTQLPGVTILERSDWPRLISFFKPRITALDAFWDSAKYGFEALR